MRCLCNQQPVEGIPMNVPELPRSGHLIHSDI
jgi:hypothetical protein